MMINLLVTYTLYLLLQDKCINHNAYQNENYNLKYMKINNNISKSPKNLKPVYRNSSTSHQKKRKDNFPSFVFQNVRNSLCAGSPRHIQHKESTFKYRAYVQAIDTGKITPNLMSKRNSFAFQKRKSMTPTPKRNSLSNAQRRKHSVFQNFHNNNQNKSKGKKIVKQTKQSSRQKHPLRPSNSKNTNLCVKGKPIKHQDKSRKKGFNLNIKISQPNSKAVKQKQKKKKEVDIQNQTIRTNISSEQKLNVEEEKVLNKLFKGIEFHRDLGKGAHALVKSAVDWNHKRKIAVKIYQKMTLNQQEIKSIEKEVEILMSLSHPNIIRLYQIIQSYKTINLIMEYGGGNSLEQFIKNKTEGRLTQQQTAKVFIQVLNAVVYLDKMNIVHRDLKTQNILLNKHLQLKIIDFGFSLICPSDGKINSYCGTPTYMAPQVVTKTPHNPHLADRWSLGVLLYTMLNGCCPFKAVNQKQLFEKIQAGEYWFLSNVSDQAKSLIERFLVKDPKDRISPQEALQSEWVIKYKQNLVQQKTE